MTAREAASALRWWLESGVNVAVQEDCRNWLERTPPPSTTVSHAPPAQLPETLTQFRDWLTGPSAPLASPNTRAVVPEGAEGAEVMILTEPPSRDDVASGKPVGGAAGELLQRMLKAIDAEESAYCANLACFHSPGARLTPKQMEACAAAARQHVKLAKPKRLLLLGDAACQTLLGKPLLEAREHVHKIEGIRTVATFHPRQLMKRPSDKALAWKDLLLLVEDKE